MSFISRKSLFSAQVTKIFLVYFYWLSSPSRLFNTLTFLNKMGNEISSALQDDDDDIIMLAWWWCHRTKKEKFVFSRNRKAFFNALPEDLKVQLCMKMRRHFVALPPLSPWHKLFLSGDDAALITTTGFDHEGFSWLLQNFEEVYDNTTALGKYDYITHQKKQNGQAKAVRCHGLFGSHFNVDPHQRTHMGSWCYFWTYLVTHGQVYSIW